MGYQVLVEIYRAKAISDKLQAEMEAVAFAKQVEKFAKQVEECKSKELEQVIRSGLLVILGHHYVRNKHIWPTT